MEAWVKNPEEQLDSCEWPSKTIFCVCKSEVVKIKLFSDLQSPGKTTKVLPSVDERNFKSHVTIISGEEDCSLMA